MITLFLLCALSTAAQARAALVSPQPHYEQIAKRFADRLPESHLTGRPLDDRLSRQAWTNVFTSLDFERVYFLQSDLDEFATYKDRLDNMLAAGNTTFGYEVFNRFRERVRERCDYVAQLLDTGFDLTIDESYPWRRRNAPWPATEAERDNLWRLKVKNDYLRRIVADTLRAEAATNTLSTTAASTNASGTNATMSVTSPAEELTPEAYVLKGYTRMLTVLEDSDAEWVLQRYLSAFSHAYDPHSEYMSPTEVEDFDIEMKLSLHGIGALLRSEDGAARVVSLIPGGPADRDKSSSRLKPGDKIIGVGQGDQPLVDILHMPLTRIVRLIRGPKNTRVVLRVIPASDPSGTSTRTVSIIRDEVKLEEQAASYTIHRVERDDGTPHRLAVIDLPAFYASMNIPRMSDPSYRSASRDVASILSGLETQRVDGVVLDLRNNGGGSLLEAVQMVGLFIRTGPTVQVRESSRIRVLPDRNPFMAYSGPLVVLVSRLSASASEIVAGALQDYGRALVVGGRKTHGKGTVQTIAKLGGDPRLGSLRVTTASYYRISGASTQLRGIVPDLVIESPFDYMDLGEDALPNPLPWTSVMRTRFMPIADLDFVIPELRRRSDERRAGDERYVAYRQLLERVRAINEAEALPLALDTRLDLARSERELTELQESLAAMHPSPDDNGKAPDLVLEEALAILSDYVVLRPPTSANPFQDATDDRKPLLDVIRQWMDSVE